MFRRAAAGSLGIVAALGTAAIGQDAFVFSFSGNGQWPALTVEDQEVASFDPATGMARPYFSTANGAFFTGDLNGDGLADEWGDVDALCVAPGTARRAGVAWLSLISDQGPFEDGDILHVDQTGVLQVALAEDALVSAFGVTDGNLDVDALHWDPQGDVLLSFAEDEDSSVLSTDSVGLITDGSILQYNPASGAVALVYTEADVDQMVTQARGAITTTGDVLALALHSSGELYFSVQSPSSDDATVFSDAAGGTLVLAEAQLGLTNAAELVAMALASMPFVGLQATPRAPIAGESVQIIVASAQPSQSCSVLLSWQPASSTTFPGAGFHGLFVDPSDPLFSVGLAMAWTYATTDAAGQATIQVPSVPVGVQGQLFGQVFDWTSATFGTPFVIDLQG
jgi:hypothetical protein